jgi:hypothetical protein
MPGINPALPAVLFGTAVPTASGGYQTQGTFLINSDPGVGEPMGWICTADGTPGTWVALAPANPTAFTTVAAPSVLAHTRFGVLTSTAAGSYTLSAASAVANGFVETFFNNGASVASTIVAGAGNTLIGGALTTSTQFVRLSVASDGVSSWYIV